MAAVDPELIERYRRDGFVVVEGLLTDEELERYGTHDVAAPRRAAAGAAAPAAVPASRVSRLARRPRRPGRDPLLTRA